jgi:hypothetical protein
MAIEFERGQLYEEVWSAPLSRLGPKYGLSDNGLRKVCKAMDIPLPERGYWARRAAGQSIERPPLPADAARITVHSNPPPRGAGSINEYERPEDAEWLRAQFALESSPQRAVQFIPAPRKWHPVLAPRITRAATQGSLP